MTQTKTLRTLLRKRQPDMCPVLYSLLVSMSFDVPVDVSDALCEWARYLPGSYASRQATMRRGYLATDYMLRVFMPLALEEAGGGWSDRAAHYRALEPIRGADAIEQALTLALGHGDETAEWQLRGIALADRASKSRRTFDRVLTGLASSPGNSAHALPECPDYIAFLDDVRVIGLEW